MEADREGNRSHSFNSSCNFVSFADFILHIYVYNIAQHFVSQYDFYAINDQDDNGSPGA
jgi:hypothetical protein